MPPDCATIRTHVRCQAPRCMGPGQSPLSCWRRGRATRAQLAAVSGSAGYIVHRRVGGCRATWSSHLWCVAFGFWSCSDFTRRLLMVREPEEGEPRWAGRAAGKAGVEENRGRVLRWWFRIWFAKPQRQPLTDRQQGFRGGHLGDPLCRSRRIRGSLGRDRENGSRQRFNPKMHDQSDPSTPAPRVAPSRPAGSTSPRRAATKHQLTSLGLSSVSSAFQFFSETEHPSQTPRCTAQ